jgi:hypothetical protein
MRSTIRVRTAAIRRNPKITVAEAVRVAQVDRTRRFAELPYVKAAVDASTAAEAEAASARTQRHRAARAAKVAKAAAERSSRVERRTTAAEAEKALLAAAGEDASGVLGQIGTLEFPSRESFEALLGLREQQEPVRDELYRSVDDLSVEMLAELPPAAMAEVVASAMEEVGGYNKDEVLQRLAAGGVATSERPEHSRSQSDVYFVTRHDATPRASMDDNQLRITSARTAKVTLVVRIAALHLSEAAEERLRALAEGRVSSCGRFVRLNSSEGRDTAHNRQLVSATFRRLLDESLKVDDRYAPLSIIGEAPVQAEREAKGRAVLTEAFGADKAATMDAGPGFLPHTALERVAAEEAHASLTAHLRVLEHVQGTPRVRDAATLPANYTLFLVDPALVDAVE